MWASSQHFSLGKRVPRLASVWQNSVVPLRFFSLNPSVQGHFHDLGEGSEAVAADEAVLVAVVPGARDWAAHGSAATHRRIATRAIRSVTGDLITSTPLAIVVPYATTVSPSMPVAAGAGASACLTHLIALVFSLLDQHLQMRLIDACLALEVGVHLRGGLTKLRYAIALLRLESLSPSLLHQFRGGLRGGISRGTGGFRGCCRGVAARRRRRRGGSGRGGSGCR